MAGQTKAKLTTVQIGGTGPALVMTEEDAQAYLAMSKTFLAELRPEGMREEDLVRRITDTSWRLDRMRNIAGTLRGLAKEELQPAIEKADREESRLSRMLELLRKQFEKLRTKRRSKQISEAFAKTGHSRLIH